MSEKDVGKRIQNVKMEYDKAIDDHALVQCGLCGDQSEDCRTQDVENEATGVVATVDLCPTCRDLTERYNNGDDVKDELVERAKKPESGV